MFVMVYVPPVYPTTIPTLTDLPNRSDDTDWVTADRYNEIKKELRAALVELGTLPKAGYADVDARLDAIEASITPIPSGLIALWTGTLANIPAGWNLCDGVDGRPNLLDKFVVGVPNDSTDPGGTGGEATHILSIAEMPAHTHTETYGRAWDAGAAPNIPAYRDTIGPTQFTGDSTGGGGAHENRPPFYVVAYIIKS